jgi:hypothetical protein
MFGRFVALAIFLAGSAQAQMPVEKPQTQSSRAELEEFAKGCAAVYLMAADTARGEDLSQAMVRGASTVD